MTSLTAPTRSVGTPLRLALLVVLAWAAWAVPHAAAAPIYWGAYIKGDTYGVDDAPFDARAIAAFETDAGKRVSIVHWGQPWYWGAQGGYMPFRADMAERVRQRGSIPMINWNSWDLDRGGALDQPDFRLAEIIGGRHDAYIRGWARAARAWGYPTFLRFDHEMNGDWFPWSERVNGNAPGEYVRTWRHVKAIFDAEGATNVTWVWAPNIVDPGLIPLASLYPGDGAVDWTGISGYNWGTHPAQPGVWRSFSQVHRGTYDALRGLAPSKPIMIAETASTERGGAKSAWITDALTAQLPASFPQIKAVLWFNWNVPASPVPLDWTIESSPASRAAFAAGIASSHYAANGFGSLSRFTKVVPIADVAAPAAGSGGSGGAAAGGSGAAGGAGAAARLGGIVSLRALLRCGADRPLCLRVVFRAPRTPSGGLRYVVLVREVAGGRPLLRRVGRVAAGSRRSMILGSRRTPRCGRVAVRLTLGAAGPGRVSTERVTIRRRCVPPAGSASTGR